ncbi:MAG: DUF2092 domain-containing protein [Halieaceae bacterium]|jgi:hypothetical protein|nr:DUF2092 domain-containing protein [Halieaceae bacterium]
MRSIHYFAAVVMWVGLSSTAVARPEIDAQANEVLKAVNTYMSGLDALLISAEVSEESVYGDNHKLLFVGTVELGIRHPAQFFTEHHTNFKNRRTYLNQGTFTVFDEDVNVYAQASAPGSLNDVFTKLHARYGISSPGSELFSGNAYELLVSKASRVIYVGESTIGGRACHHIAGVLADMDWQLWVQKEGDPQLCRYVITDRNVPMAPQFSITFDKWQANANISNQRFNFRAPADAEAIEFVK